MNSPPDFFSLPNGKIFIGDSQILAEEVVPLKSQDLALIDPPYFNSPADDTWVLPDVSKLASMTAWSLKDTGIAVVFATNPFMADIYNAMKFVGFRFMFDSVWIKNRPTLSSSVYPLRLHIPIYFFMRVGIKFSDTHVSRERIATNAGSSKKASPSKHRILNKHPNTREKKKMTVGMEKGIPTTVIYAKMVTRDTPEYIGHPTQIAEKVADYCIGLTCKEGDSIFDPYFGSGTTGIIAKKRKLHFTGIEIDFDRANAAQKRINARQILNGFS